MSDPTQGWANVDFLYADLHLPECSGIYIVFAARMGRDIPVYVGQSKNLRQRWKLGHHKAIACMREGAEFIRYLPVNETDLDTEEKHWLQLYEPCLNEKL